MRSLLALLVLALAASGCNCGRQGITMTQASLALPADLLDFGIVVEGTSKGGKFRVDNVGRAPITLAVNLAAGSSADFALGAVPMSIEGSSFIEVPVIFTPASAGEDDGLVEVKTEGSTELPLVVRLHGGPIVAALAFEPDPLDFRPALSALERKTVQLKSVGTAALTVRSVGVEANGNPDFSVVPPALPTRLLPGESVGVRVEYARSVRTTEGLMEVLSDDADAGLRRLRLLPDAPRACDDGVDNDSDGLIDFPDDPGCENANDDDEYNPAQCVNGATQPCGDGGVCGTRSCANGVWGACTGGSCPVDAGVDAGFDAGVDAGVDAGTGSCNPNGTFVLDAGVIGYTCCNFGFGPTVDVDISQFQIQSTATVLRPTPKQPGNTLPSVTAATCPAGAFSYQRVISGGGAGCTETYTLTGNFVGPNTFVGTYSVGFTGPQCAGSLCASDPCTNQSWNISAGR